jgi:hypothetical protein
MAFGMKSPIAADFAEIVKFDARAGRLFVSIIIKTPEKKRRSISPRRRQSSRWTSEPLRWATPISR